MLIVLRYLERSRHGGWQQSNGVKGVRKGGGLNHPLELDIFQKIYYLRKEINCFRILFAC